MKLKNVLITGHNGYIGPHMIEILNNKGGFVSAHWDGSAETENKIKEFTKATIRCIPLDNDKSEGKCVFSGEKSDQRVLFAKAY